MLLGYRKKTKIIGYACYYSSTHSLFFICMLVILSEAKNLMRQNAIQIFRDPSPMAQDDKILFFLYFTVQISK